MSVQEFPDGIGILPATRTADKGILKKTTEILQIKIINPINLIIEWEAQQ